MFANVESLAKGLHCKILGIMMSLVLPIMMCVFLLVEGRRELREAAPSQESSEPETDGRKDGA